jgi:hypothetical protein
MLDSVILQHLTLCQGHDCLLAIRFVTGILAASSLFTKNLNSPDAGDRNPLAFLLALVVDCFERLLNFNLIRARIHDERVLTNDFLFLTNLRVSEGECHGFFSEVRRDDDIVWIFHLAQTSSIAARASFATMTLWATKTSRVLNA